MKKKRSQTRTQAPEPVFKNAPTCSCGHLQSQHQDGLNQCYGVYTTFLESHDCPCILYSEKTGISCSGVVIPKALTEIMAQLDADVHSRITQAFNDVQEILKRGKFK